MTEAYRLHAAICKTIAHPKRLQILDLLRRGEMTVNDIAQAVEAKAANVSQQLAVLRSAGVVRTRREGTSIHYRIANPKIMHAYDLMAEVLEEEMASIRSQLARSKRRGRPRSRRAS
jgi:ArsR family transcriptional regulator